MLELKQLAGLDLLVLPYRGSAPALTDLLAGRVQLMINPVSASLPQLREGCLRALAVTSPRRIAAAPDIPTAAEAGMPGLEIFSWYGVWGPRDLLPEAVARVNAALAEGMRDADAVQRLAPFGIEPVAESPERFARYIAADVAQNAALLRAANYTPE